jgi:two-component system, NtrC family, response regulator PilR
VRELENILERAIALSASGLVDTADLQLRQLTPAPVPATGESQASTAPAPAPVPATTTGSSAAPLGDQLENIERDAIVRALEQTRYNKTAAAKLLGMSFRALRYRVKKLGIE